MSPRLLFIAPSFQSRFPTPESRVSNTASSLPPSKQDPRKSVPSARSVFHFFKPDKSTRSLQKIINFYSKLFAQNGSHQPQPKPARLPFLRVVGVYPTIWIAKHPCPQTWNLELSGGRASSGAKRVDAKRYHHHAKRCHHQGRRSQLETWHDGRGRSSVVSGARTCKSAIKSLL
jgi:hypothetical protein